MFESQLPFFSVISQLSFKRLTHSSAISKYCRSQILAISSKANLYFQLKVKVLENYHQTVKPNLESLLAKEGFKKLLPFF